MKRRHFFLVSVMYAIIIFLQPTIAGSQETSLEDLTCNDNSVTGLNCNDTRSGIIYVDGQGVFSDHLYYSCECVHPTPNGCPSNPTSEIPKDFIEDIFRINTPAGTKKLRVEITHHQRMNVYFYSCQNNGFCEFISNPVVSLGKRIYNLDVTGMTPVYIIIDGHSNNGTQNSAIPYSFTVSCQTEVLDCSDAETISCGESISSSNIGLPNRSNGYDCFTGTGTTNFTGGEKIFKFIPPVTKEYLIKLVNFSGDLDLVILDDCDANSCINKEGATEKSTEIASHVLTKGREYYFVVDGFNGNESNFVIELTCPFDCGDAEQISCGETISGSTKEGSNDFIYAPYYTCWSQGSGSDFNGPDQVFKVRKSSIEGILSLHLYSSSSNHLSLFVFDECPQNLSCLGKGSNILNDRGQVIGEYWSDENDPLPRGTYYIIVDGSDEDIASDFSLTATCGLLNCSNADEIKVGESKSNERNSIGDNNTSIYKCSDQNYTGYIGNERIYEFTLTDDQTINIDLSINDRDDDFDLFLMKKCGSECIAISGSQAGESEQIGPIFLTAGRYYIIVDAKRERVRYRESRGTFNISLSGYVNDCDLGTSACDGMIQGEWLDSIASVLAACCSQSGPFDGIFECIYLGQKVIHVPTNSCSFPDAQGMVYDCSGNVIFAYGGLDGNYNRDKFEQLMNCEAIWTCTETGINCDGSVEICDLSSIACSGMVVGSWLDSIVSELTTCCLESGPFTGIYECIYQGQTVIHIPPVFCGITDVQGMVYECSGNLIFAYGGIDGNYNRDKFEQLMNCIPIWTCTETGPDCQPTPDICNLDSIACDGQIEGPWLENIVKILTSCCGSIGPFDGIFECVYEGKKVIYIPPVNCRITNNQGLVYDCNGNLLFDGGIEGTANRDKFARLLNCSPIWTCTETGIVCRPPEQYCDLASVVCGGRVEGNWLDSIVTALTICCGSSGPFTGIYECIYLGQKVIHVPTNSCSFPDAQGLVYDCKGSVVFAYGGLDGNYNRDKLEQLMNCRAVWTCGETGITCAMDQECELEGLDCGAMNDLVWLDSFILSWWTPCCEVGVPYFAVFECTYLGQPVIHVPPIPCSRSDFPGLVYDCSGTVVFSYGGVDADNNRDKFNQLKNCKVIWSCGETGVSCQVAAPAWSHNFTSRSHTIIVLEDVESDFDGEKLQHGDFIGFFYRYDGRIYNSGLGMWTGSELEVKVYGNDADSGKNGFRSGENFGIRIWRQTTGEEFRVYATYVPPNGRFSSTDLFAEMGKSGISKLAKSNTTAIHDVGLDEFLQVYPNPVQNGKTLVVKNDAKLRWELEIVTITGKTLERLTVPAVPEYQVELNQMTGPGVYFLSFVSGGIKISQKLIVF